MSIKQFKNIDIEILRKMDKPGPRYTSYPTAPLFTRDFGPAEYLEEIISSNRQNRKPDLSLYFHMPFCDTLCYFCGCTMIITKNRNKIKEYNEYLKREVDLVRTHISDDRVVKQLHWGGGTPSYLEPEEIRDIAEHVRKRFQYDRDIESGVEIDPRGLLIDHLEALKETGFNRISMGVQDFNEKVQHTINRIQPEEMTRQVVAWSRNLGFQSINLDLIYGLPHQTLETFSETLEKIIDIDPDRLAVFNYAHVPWLKPHQKLIKPEDLPSPDEKLAILKYTIERLNSAGYWYIGMDHFAKPGDELTVAQQNNSLQRNFQGYSTKAGCDLYGFGMSAISHLQEIYAQNYKSLKDYYRTIEEYRLPVLQGYRMTGDDHIRKYVIMKLMCDFEIDTGDIDRIFKINFSSYFTESINKLSPFIEDGLIEYGGEKIIVTANGRLVIRNIAMCFDAYLETLSREKQVFSRTV